ncbi:MAG: PQQ-binding-like beta-propeller repeat protein [Planctomycetaceae bacterium]
MLARPIGGLVVAVLLGCGVASAADVPDLWERAAGGDWPAFLGPSGDGRSAETGFFTAEGPRGVTVRWQRPITGGYAMPSVSRGRLFLFSRRGDRNRLDCLRAETGAELWHFEYPTAYQDLYGYDGGPRCCPVVDDDRVYVLGAEGMLHCLGVRDGAVIWKLDTVAEFGVVPNFFGVGSTPVVEGDLLIANVGGSPPEGRDVPPGQLDRVRGADSGVVAFDKRTGEVRWRCGDELASYASPTLATIAGRRWGFVFARGGLVGFDPATGRQDFHFPWRAKILESVNAANPVIVGDEVLVSECYGPGAALLKVRPGGCEVVWQDDARQRRKILQCHWSTPIHHEGFVYGCSGRHTENAELRCVEWKTGRVAWSQPGLGRASLLLVDGHLVCLTEGGDLLVVRATPERFEQVAEIPLEGEPPAPGAERPKLLTYPAWAAPILAHGLLYVRGADRLVCIELARKDAGP